MKVHLITLIALLTLSTTLAQSPSTDAAKQRTITAIESKSLKPATYSTEADYWQQQVTANATNEDAWLNLYKATRYASYTEHSRTISTEAQAKLTDLLAKMNNSVPNSFAFNYSAYLNANHSDESFAYLKKANTLRPDDVELWDDMLCHAIITNSPADIKKWSTQLSQSATYTDAQMEYSRNVLNSVERDGILVTHGNVDTYPILLLQQVYAVRTDVKLICLDWYGSATYVSSVTTLVGLKTTKNKTGDPYSSLTAILSDGSAKNIYLALTLPPDVLKKEAKNLYCTGLAMKYSKKELQNLESLLFNWENLFQKNYLSSSDDINRNYLVPLLLLRDYYTQHGNTAKADEMKLMAEQTAARHAVSNQIKKQLD